MLALLIAIGLFAASCSFIAYVQIFSVQAIKRRDTERKRQESAAAARRDLYDRMVETQAERGGR